MDGECLAVCEVDDIGFEGVAKGALGFGVCGLGHGGGAWGFVVKMHHASFNIV